MRFKQAVKSLLSQSFPKDRFIRRDSNWTLFDVQKYQPSLLQDEDLWATDWRVVDLETVKEMFS